MSVNVQQLLIRRLAEINPETAVQYADTVMRLLIEHGLVVAEEEWIEALQGEKVTLQTDLEETRRERNEAALQLREVQANLVQTQKERDAGAARRHIWRDTAHRLSSSIHTAGHQATHALEQARLDEKRLTEGA